MHSSQCDLLLIIPKELISIIFSLLDTPSIFTLSRTSKKYINHSMIDSSLVGQTIFDIHMSTISEGHIDQFRWLMPENEIQFIKDHHYGDTAAVSGQLDILRYLGKNKYNFNKWICNHAAISGKIEVMKYLRENGSFWYKGACENAAGNGHLEVLKYLHENGCEWDGYACVKAAEGGHLETLKYLHENRCQWNEYTLSRAVLGGRLFRNRQVSA